MTERGGDKQSEREADGGCEGDLLRARWRELAEESLKGRPLSRLTRESEPGVEIEPLYWGSHEPSAACRESDALRPGGSSLCARLDQGGWREGRALALEAVEGGAAALAVRWGGAGDEGLRLPHQGAVEALLAPLWLEGLPIYLEPGEASVEKASLFLSALDRRVKAERPAPALVSLGLDPIGGLLRRGVAREPVVRTVAHGLELSAAWGAPSWLRLFEVDEGIAHEAGADEAQGLSLALASAVEYLRLIEATGSPLSALAPFTFHLRLDARIFHSLAKIRAFRQLWSRVAGSAGLRETSPRIRCSLSARSLSEVDPWVNLLRGTAVSFAALTGGVEAYEPPRFDLLIGGGGPLGRRLSRNTGLLLAEEGQLGRVADPAGGAAFIESLTAQLAAQSWSLFQEIEAAGGALAALRSGAPQRAIEGAARRREEAIRYGRQPLTGISAFPLLGERLPEPAPLPLAAPGEEAMSAPAAPAPAPLSGALSTPRSLREAVQQALTEGDWLSPWRAALPHHDLKALWLARRGEVGEAPIEALTPWRQGELFESLRAHGEEVRQLGHPAALTMLCFGPLAHYGARATFAENALAAGGIGVERILIEEGTLAAHLASLPAAPAPLIFCASEYSSDGPAHRACAALTALSPRKYWTVGAPEEPDTWETLGWEGAIQRGVDLPALLAALWSALDALTERREEDLLAPENTPPAVPLGSR